jgi:hypothetical protein
MIILEDGRHLRMVGANLFRPRLLLMPGFAKWKDDQFFFEPTRMNVEWVEREFPAAEWRCNHLKDVQNLRERELQSLRGAHFELPPADDFEFKTTPMQHQIDAFMRSRDMKWFAYFMEMGTGKTKVFIDNAAYLWHNNLIDAVIVFAPNGVHEQFVTEQIPIHMPSDVAIDCLVYQSGGKKQYQQRKRAFLKPNLNKLRILTVNIEAMSHASGVHYLIEFLKSLGSPGSERPIICGVDESTRIKNSNSIRSVNVRKIGACCAYRRLLSGSPVTKGVQDLFGQMQFLSSKILGFSSFYTFRNHFCLLKQGGTTTNHKGEKKSYDSIAGFKNLEELQRKLAPYAHRVKKEDCLDLPPKVYMKREVPLNDQQKEMYRQLRSELLLEFDGMELTAPLAAVRMTKLQQIVCGHIRFTDQQKLVEIPNIPRIEALQEMVEDIDGQVIVWGRFQPDIDRMCKALGDFGVSRYDGLVSKEDREVSKRNFIEGKTRVFVSNPAVGATGLNLQCATYAIYYSNSFDAEHRWQSEDRCHRQGTTSKVTYIDMIAPHTIDSYILATLARKKDIASLTIDELRAFLTEDV